MSRQITELAFSALSLSIEMGERLASIQNLLGCQSGHSDADIVAKVREIVHAPGALRETMTGIKSAAAELARELKTIDYAIELARARVASLLERKNVLEQQPPISDLAWQYADGCVNGAREVLAALVKGNES